MPGREAQAMSEVLRVDDWLLSVDIEADTCEGVTIGNALIGRMRDCETQSHLTCGNKGGSLQWGGWERWSK